VSGRTYAVRVLSEKPREVLAVLHVSTADEAGQLARHASEDGMRAEVFDVSVQPSRLVASFEDGAFVVDGVIP
jgi:predicted lactoylglutathione lyase